MKIQKNQFLSTEGGLLEVLRIALPLIMGAAAHALNLLSDRVMLSHYSEEAVAASLTGGLTGFTIACFFLGTIGFTGSFVAQYSGAGATRRPGEFSTKEMLSTVRMICYDMFTRPEAIEKNEESSVYCDGILQNILAAS